MARRRGRERILLKRAGARGRARTQVCGVWQATLPIGRSLATRYTSQQPAQPRSGACGASEFAVEAPDPITNPYATNQARVVDGGRYPALAELGVTPQHYGPGGP